MTIEVINEQKRMNVLFADTSSFEEISGKHPDTYNYFSASEDNNMFWLNTTANLFDSKFEVSNNTKKGINEDGSTFYQNSWTAVRFSITFSPVLNKVFNKLRSTIRYKNKPLKVIVNFDETEYTGYFILNNASIEEGKLDFESAYSGKDGFWNCGDGSKKFYLRNSEPSYVQDTPNQFLGKYEYPKTLEFESSIDAPVKITFYNLIHEDSEADINIDYTTTLTFTHVNSGVTYYMEFYETGDTHVFDTNTFTHTFNGNTDTRPKAFMTLTGGSELFELKMETKRHNLSNADIDFVDSIPKIDSFINIEYDDLRSGLYV